MTQILFVYFISHLAYVLYVLILHADMWLSQSSHCKAGQGEASLKCSGDQIKQENRAYASVIHPRYLNTCYLCKTLVFHTIPESNNISVKGDLRT